MCLSMLFGGPQPTTVRIAVSGAQPWKATASNPDALAVSPAQGTGSGAISATFAGWWAASRPPGTYTASVTITDEQKMTQTVAFTLTVVALRIVRRFREQYE